MTYEEMMQWMLDRVPDDIDKREDKSLIWHTLGPSAAMMAETWAYGDNIHNGSIPDNEMCAGDVLTRKCAEHGVNRQESSHAVRRGIFTDSSGNPASVNSGDRFAAEGISYVVLNQLRDGEYRLQCETAGIVGNQYFGAILPLGEGHQLGSATLADVLVPGEEAESDQALRLRFYIEVNALPFGGNVDQYSQWIQAIPGVGNHKVFPTPNNQGGRVHIVIVGPDNEALSDDFISDIQELIDPEPHAQGLGTAPIGHRVTISTVEEVVINISATLLLKDGFSLDSVRADIRAAMVAYLAELSFVDDTVRIAHVESRTLAVEGVKDHAGITLNGVAGNIPLLQDFDCYQVPVLGTLELAEG